VHSLFEQNKDKNMWGKQEMIPIGYSNNANNLATPTASTKTKKLNNNNNNGSKQKSILSTLAVGINYAQGSKKQLKHQTHDLTDETSQSSIKSQQRKQQRNHKNATKSPNERKTSSSFNIIDSTTSAQNSYNSPYIILLNDENGSPYNQKTNSNDEELALEQKELNIAQSTDRLDTVDRVSIEQASTESHANTLVCSSTNFPLLTFIGVISALAFNFIT
jgi:hypothetical protein